MTSAEDLAIQHRIGVHLLSQRIKLDLSQDAMAKLIGCSKIGLARYEGGTRPIPDYIAKHVAALVFCHEQGLLLQLLKHVEKHQREAEAAAQRAAA